MWKLIAMVALLCGAASADAAEPQKWCSRGFSGPNAFSGPNDNVLAVLTIGDNVLELRIDGKDVTDDYGWEEALTPATISYESEGIEYKNERALLFHGRVFWPCEKSE
jgi:hypothetical protein